MSTDTAAVLPVGAAKKKKWISGATKPSTRGLFTKYCKSLGYGSTTLACIRKGKRSKKKKIRQRANFAERMHEQARKRKLRKKRGKRR